MRILIGPADTSTNAAVQQAAPDCGHEFVTFGGEPAEIAWTPADDFATLMSRLPTGWTPDLLIFCSPEYRPIPRGIEEAECVTVAIVGDWNLGGQAFQLAGEMFDILASDRNGCDLMRAAGFPNVVYVPFFSYDPAVLRRMEGMERDIDVAMIGNFHGEIQRGRAPWVARVAQLSHKHNVVLTHGVFGDEYARLMNRAKIVFNRSIRGEINMRVYEAAACGALLFYERENREIRELFTDREDCVLYGDDDLEDLLDYYLAHDDERTRIAESGWRKVQAHTPALKTVDIVRRIQAAIESGTVHPDPSTRPFRSLPAHEKQGRRAWQWMLGADDRAIGPACSELAASVQANPNDPAIAGAYGGTLFLWATRGACPDELPILARQAAAHLNRAADLSPTFIVTRLNLAELHLAMGARGPAEMRLREAAKTLESGAFRPADLVGALVPRVFSSQEVDLEWTWAFHAPESAEWTAEVARILHWRCAERLGHIAFEEADFPEALRWTALAAQLAPDRGSARRDYARALRALGRTNEAVDEYRAAVRLSPLDIWIRKSLVSLLIETGRAEEANELLNETERLLDGAPCFAEHRADFEALRQAACPPIPDSDRLQLLAFPDWNSLDWQPLLAAYAREFAPADPVSLRLRIEPGIHPAVDQLVPAILAFAQGSLGIAPEDLPDLTLVADPIAPEDRWKLFLPANMLVSGPDSAENVYAEARGLKIVAVEDLATVAARLSCPTLRRSEPTPCLSTCPPASRASSGTARSSSTTASRSSIAS